MAGQVQRRPVCAPEVHAQRHQSTSFSQPDKSVIQWCSVRVSPLEASPLQARCKQNHSHHFHAHAPNAHRTAPAPPPLLHRIHTPGSKSIPKRNRQFVQAAGRPSLLKTAHPSLPSLGKHENMQASRILRPLATQRLAAIRPAISARPAISTRLFHTTRSNMTVHVVKT